MQGIRCKHCGKLWGEADVKGECKFDFKCKRCGSKNLITITKIILTEAQKFDILIPS